MLNLVQISERLKGMPLQVVMQYANGTNPEVPPYIALGELQRRKKMEQDAQQSAAMQQNPQQQPTVKQGIEQTFRPPAPPPQMQGVASLPAPNMERGFANGGIVAFEDGGRVERYQSQGFVMPPRYKRTEYFDLFGRNERLGGNVDFDEQKFKEDEQELARIKSGLESGIITNPAALGKLVALERDVQAGKNYLAQRKALQTQAPAAAPAAAQRASSVGDAASLGLDRGSPAATRQRRQQQPELAQTPPSAMGEPTATAIDFPTVQSNPASAGLLEQLQRTAEQQQQQNQQQQELSASPGLTDEAKLRQRLAARNAIMKDLGLSGKAGDEIRTQVEEMRAAQEKAKEQSGLAGLASMLTAYGAAPRKRALGAAAQAGSQFFAGQKEAERKFEMDMAALKASAARADRAEMRGDLDAVMKENQFQETLRAEMDRIRAQIESREKEGAAERATKVSEGALDRQLNEKLTNAKIKAQVDLAKMDDNTKRWVASRPPETLRVIEAIAKDGKMSFNEALDKFLTKGENNTAQLLKVWNEMSSSEKAKFGGNQAVFLATFGSGAMKAPSDVTVSERKQ